ncbi:MAG: SpoIIE family protein phosphatase [Candidatus Sericytochromatia bacterium]|nr:SpoIIE family protein phosphatase [Candidatus Tanganyikabacteria bacterium]
MATKGLKVQLLAGFCALAILPTLAVLFAVTRTGEANLVGTVSNVSTLGQSSLREAGNAINRSALQTLTDSSHQLIALSARAIDRTSDALIGVAEDQFQDASRQIIQRSGESTDRLAGDLIAANREATDKLSLQLIALSTESGERLALTTSGIAERAILDGNERLARINSELADKLALNLARANEAAAQDVSNRLRTELQDDPLVNFRLLAQVIAQTFAGGQISAESEAYLLDINSRGRVVASTRFRKGSSVQDLDIVKRALHDDPRVAAAMPLITYQDGGETYLGVYARKKRGGAFITSYKLSRARADLAELGSLVDTSLSALVAETSARTRDAFAGSTERMAGESAALSGRTIATIKRAAETRRREDAAGMRRSAARLSSGHAADMAAKAERLAKETTGQLQAESAAITERALARMAPIGQESAARAAKEMTGLATQAVADVKGRLQPQIDRATRTTAERMQPQADLALANSRRHIWGVGVWALFISTLIGVLVSVMLSRRIADPIEVERKLKEAELGRLNREMEIAAQIQMALVPTDLAVPDFELAMELQTATEVGGDLMDYIPRPDGRFWLAIGDVTGHGLKPGLMMMMAQSIFSGLVTMRPDAGPSELLASLNRSLYQSVRYRLRDDNFMTLQLVHHLGDGRFVAAGLHCAYLIYRHEADKVEWFETSGTWTGLLPDIEEITRDYRFELAKDDVLLLYTDGLIEAKNAQGQQYDVGRLEQAFHRFARLPVEEIKAALLADVRRFMHAQDDDISVIVLKRTVAAAQVQAA